jgi:hypothetical protein
MEHELGSAYCSVSTFVRTQVAFDDLDVEPFQSLSPAGCEVVEDANLASVGEEPAHEVVADESRSAGDQRSSFIHGRTIFIIDAALAAPNGTLAS